jgi:hypothetical protein
MTFLNSRHTKGAQALPGGQNALSDVYGSVSPCFNKVRAESKDILRHICLIITINVLRLDTRQIFACKFYTIHLVNKYFSA